MEIGYSAVCDSMQALMTIELTSEARLLSPELVEEAARQFNICNACRYCEGLCAVFPALERRIEFLEPDITFLANLCHDCRACFDACPYVSPHVFAVNIPPLMSLIREETFESFTVPRRFGTVSRTGVTFVLSLVAVLLVVATTLLAIGYDAFFAVHEGAGAFYRVVPFAAMTIPSLAIVTFGILAMYLGGRRFKRMVDESVVPTRGRDIKRTLLDVLLFRNMDGGGPGCNYPKEELSYTRRLAHSLVFYGFGLALASTTVAAIYQDLLHLMPPYDLFSLPVMLGVAGGILMVVACALMLYQKSNSRRILESAGMKTMDMSFIGLILMVNLTGLALLAARATTLMGLLLTTHLGLVLAFFVTLPYGKFVHGIYRTLALYRNASEESG